MSLRGSGKRLSESQRLDIIKKLQRSDAPSKRAIAREYEVSDNVIRKIWTNRTIIEQRTSLMSNSALSTSFRASSGKFKEIEDILCLWIDTMRRAKLEVPPSLIIAKAKQIALSLGINEETFKASWQWLKNFKARRGLKSMLLKGEGVDVDKNVPERLQRIDNLYNIIAEYDADNVFNMNETGLFYKLLPRYTLLMPDEEFSTTRGKQKSKERVSLVVCTNATGTFKIPCTIIGKSKNPSCIVGREWPIPYYSQEKALMDVETCWKWFNEVFFPSVKERTGGKVLLLMDNAPVHFDSFERDDVRVIFFPPNCTSWRQPCDAGIITALKKRYKYKYLKDVLSFYDLEEELKQMKRQAGSKLKRGAAGVEYGNPANLLDAAKYIKLCWDMVTPETIMNSFSKAEILSLHQHDNIQLDKEDDDIMELLHRLSLLQVTPEEIDEYIHIDDQDSPLYVEEVVSELFHYDNNVNLSQDNTEYNENVVSRFLDIQHENEFEGFQSLYKKVLLIREQIDLKHFKTIGAENKYDILCHHFENIEGLLRSLCQKSIRQSRVHNVS